MKILDEFYNGNISASDRPASYYMELNEITSLLNKNRDKLLDGLTDEQKHLYRQIERFFCERKKIDDRYAFLAGYRLGVQMTSESLADEN
ncbi:MAG: hypothetical protein J6N32_00960 [Clostridia bacterium]|nr:hypothetical protein [Clostridia bacterium]